MLNVLNTLVNAFFPTAKAPAPVVTQAEESSEARAYRTCCLLMVTADNNNKFYDMVENGDNTFTATYGRVGTQGAKRTYPLNQWDAKYREKINKGYKDQTSLFAAVKELDDECSGIENVAAKNLMRQLMQYAKQSIKYHYNVNASQVSEKQVDEAQTLLNSLLPLVALDMDVAYFNETLIRLYHVIPRRMKHVKDHLVQAPTAEADLEAIKQLLYAEQCTLDVMHGQVKIYQQQATQPTEAPKDLLETMGLKIEKVEDAKSIAKVRKMMGNDASRLKAVYQVRNLRTEAYFSKALQEAKNNACELFWHGSRNENWLSILETGLLLRPTNAIITGKMFGYGIYFADRFAKSLNYTSMHGAYWSGGTANQAFLALYKVHVGKPLKIKNYESWCSSLTYNNLKAKGKQYDSLFAEGGADLRNNEFIVYQEQQCTIEYLVEIG